MGRSRGTKSSSSSMASVLSSVRPLSQQQRHTLTTLADTLLNKCTAPTAPNAKQMWMEHLEIREIVDKIVEIEQRGNLARRLPSNRVVQAQKLLHWVKEQGGEVAEQIQIEDFKQQGLGLRCKEGSLSVDQLVLSIPRRLIMSIETAYRSEIGALIAQDPLLNCMDNVALALHLLLEKNSPASFFEPFINSLPQSFSNALYLSLKELKQLTGSPALEEALKLYKFVGRQYAYFYKKFQTSMLKDYFTYSDYVWAVSAVMTRQNKIPRSPSKEDEAKEEEERSNDEMDKGDDNFICCLIPLFDLANHSSTPALISTDYDQINQAVLCRSNRDFEEGQEFTIFYGPRGNRELLLHNGFFVQENVYSNYELRLGISRNDGLVNEKCALLSKSLNMAQQTSFFITRNNRTFDKDLLAFLRILCSNEKKQLLAWSQEENVVEILKKEVDLEVEMDRKILDYLKTRCQLLLRSYPNVDKEEESTSDLAKLCTNLVKEEQIILNEFVEFIDVCLKKGTNA